MEGAPLSLILNVVILVLLGLTIVYAARLSLQLRNLRDSKSDLDRVVRDLIKNLDRADRAVAGLRESARDAGIDLQESIDRARSMSDELQMVTDSGERLAGRLETLLDEGRPLATGAAVPPQAAAAKPDADTNAHTNAPAGKPEAGASSYAQHLRKLDPAEDRVVPSSFAIRDNDALRGEDPLGAGGDDDAAGLYSEAERDLFRAMKGKTRK